MNRLCAGVLLLFAAATAFAQDFPSRPLRILVPSVAGSSPDIRHTLLLALINNAIADVLKPDPCCRLNSVPALAEAGLPEIGAQLRATGSYAAADTPEEVAAFVRAENEKWSRVIRDAGIKPD